MPTTSKSARFFRVKRVRVRNSAGIFFSPDGPDGLYRWLAKQEGIGLKAAKTLFKVEPCVEVNLSAKARAKGV